MINSTKVDLAKEVHDVTSGKGAAPKMLHKTRAVTSCVARVALLCSHAELVEWQCRPGSGARAAPERSLQSSLQQLCAILRSCSV